jgi:phosphomannomutase/phosphoglucomutase
MSIFRAYDIRGVYPDQLNGDTAYKIGLAFGSFLGKGKVAIGADARKSSPDLSDRLAKGMLESGLDVVNVGMVPTPVLYFAVVRGKLNGGTMVTGSHNSKEFNGIKLCGKNGICFSYESGIGEVEKLVRSGASPKKALGTFVEKKIEKDYVDFVVKGADFRRPLKVVIDAGNGVAGKISSEIFRKLGCEVIELHCEPDGDFPNHHPDPLVPENLKDLQAKVKETKADAGIAYDGDGDRMGVVDDKGNVFPSNKVYALLIENVLRKNPGAKVVHEILSSKLVEDTIVTMGGIPVLSKVGHSYIEEKMIGERCVLGGETSGHYYFRESFNYDDGIFASVRLAELLSQSGKRMSELGNSLPKYVTSEDTRVFCHDETKFMVVERLGEKFKGLGKIITLDGVKVVMKNSWFIVRASNTQPALVLRWEAGNEKEFKRTGDFLLKEVEKEIKSIS